MSVFTKKDYESGEGMSTRIWGPLLWNYIHMISFNYPVNPTKEDKEYYMNFIYSLVNILPCRACRVNLPKNLKATNFSIDVMKNRDTFSRYIYKLHNTINKMLGKPCNLTFAEVRDRFETFRAKCIDDTHITLKHTEIGCVNPLYGKKAKCVISIVPVESKIESFKMDPKCELKKKPSKK